MSNIDKECDEHRHWRNIALPVSIILNLFLVALIGGHLLRGRVHEIGFGISLPRELARAEARLPPKDAAAFSAVMRRDAPRFMESRKRLSEARQEFERQITAEQFNSDAARRALTAWRMALNSFFDDFDNSLIESLSQLSPEGRRKLIDERRLNRAEDE
ncbi:MAG: periplasmic heavy metal sensor [Ferrovum sp.]|jgi:uncharacterized membrane protein|nr:periplasmic heavy metal sensor [Ferrovum sp.]